MLRERHTFAAVGWLLALVLVMAFIQPLPGAAATERDPATARSGLRSPGAPPPHLGARDIQLYRQILTIQERADWPRAGIAAIVRRQWG
jgi:hypothetical protein